MGLGWVGRPASPFLVMTVPEMSDLKTTPIPVKFDRQGHSCNFYAGFGPTTALPVAQLLLDEGA